MTDIVKQATQYASALQQARKDAEQRIKDIDALLSQIAVVTGGSVVSADNTTPNIAVAPPAANPATIRQRILALNPRKRYTFPEVRAAISYDRTFSSGNVLKVLRSLRSTGHVTVSGASRNYKYKIQETTR